MRKALSILVLVSMTLHCMSRLGAVSYVYTHRHDLAYALGISADRMIAMCKGDYNQEVRLNPSQEDDQNVPPGLAPAQEITLGCPPTSDITPVRPVASISKETIVYYFKKYFPPCAEIFHPPLA